MLDLTKGLSIRILSNGHVSPATIQTLLSTQMIVRTEKGKDKFLFYKDKGVTWDYEHDTDK